MLRLATAGRADGVRWRRMQQGVVPPRDLVAILPILPGRRRLALGTTPRCKRGVRPRAAFARQEQSAPLPGFARASGRRAVPGATDSERGRCPERSLGNTARQYRQYAKGCAEGIGPRSHPARRFSTRAKTKRAPQNGRGDSVERCPRENSKALTNQVPRSVSFGFERQSVCLAKPLHDRLERGEHR
jgi:hypothetical protein